MGGGRENKRKLVIAILLVLVGMVSGSVLQSVSVVFHWLGAVCLIAGVILGARIEN